MSKQRIDSIFLLRTMAMMMVVLVHVTATYLSALPDGSSIYQFYHFVNWSIRVEAGVFIMLTALVFFYKYKDQPMDRAELITYYKKRALYIVLPYLIWALFYEGYSIWAGTRNFDWIAILSRIVQGKSYYQLHFIFQIVQLYMVFPLLLYVIQQSFLVRKYLWLIGLVVEAGFHIISERFSLLPPELFVGHLGTYFLGGWIGLHYVTLKEKLSLTRNLWLTAATCVSGFIFLYTSYYIYTYDIHLLSRGTYLIGNMLYLISGSYLLFQLSEWVAKKSPPFIASIRNIAIYSFGFYLLHPVVLNGVRNFIPIYPGGWFHLTILFRFSGTILFCFIIIWTCHRFFPWPGLFFGKLPERPNVWKKRGAL
ncbi:acyltransferase [Halobacillus litoralis]|uniref:acyltransferase n=1 Tax=Halobacillus litoralis TaxID=45668 RepID=UPI00248F4777|nr:acyltransferase [Halobacillus litoralis]